LVLKDGQIVEHGSHRELLEQDGIFAAMWSDQISGDEPNGVAYPEGNGSANGKKVEVSGYDTGVGDVPKADVKEVQPSVHGEQEAEVPTQPPQDAEPASIPDKVAESDEAAAKASIDTGETRTAPAEEAAAFPAETQPQQQEGSYAAVAASTPDPEDNVVLAAPVPISPPSGNAPISFPTSSDEPEPASGRGSTSETPAQAASSTPNVTFDAGVQFPPSSAGSRSATPDPTAEGKRRRTTSQNLQRFARRVSLVAKRTGSSSSIPVPKKDGQQTGDGASGSVRDGSPASSIRGGEEGKKNVKEKKKRFSMSK
jgi:ATP-binding cassette subfamily B (MDR/TAP) protein 6